MVKRVMPPLLSQRMAPWWASAMGSILSATVLTALPQVLLAFDKWR